MTEQEEIYQGTIEATRQLQIPLLVQQKKGFFYCLTKKYFTTTKVGQWDKPQGAAFCNKIDGKLYPQGRKKFIEEALHDENCIGLVPLAHEVYEELMRHGLQGILKLPEQQSELSRIQIYK